MAAVSTLGTVFNVIFLLAALVALFVFGVLFAFYLLRIYQAKEDNGCCVAVVPKVVFVLSLTFVVVGSLLVPYSVLSSKLSMSKDWYAFEAVFFQIFYAIMMILVLFVIPFTCCYYESEDPYVDKSWPKQLCLGLCFSCFLTILFVILFVATYFFLGHADIEFDAYFVGIDDAPTRLDVALRPEATRCESCLKLKNQDFAVQVSIVVYGLSLCSLVGYVLFICFGGCGLTAWPLELICGYCRRPRKIREHVYAQMKLYYQNRTQRLLDLASKIDEKIEFGRFSGPSDYATFSRFKKTAIETVDAWNKIRENHETKGSQVLLHCGKLFCGILAFILSLLWIVHIILYLAIQPYWSFGFLNIVMRDADALIGFPVIGTLIYIVLVWHLLLAVFSGSTQVAANIPVIAVYPMIRGDTMLSSLLINAEVFLLISFSVGLFCAYAFGGFAANSVADVMLGSTVQKLLFFKWVYLYGVKYAFLVFAVLGFFFVIIVWILKSRPREEKDVNDIVSRATSRGGLCGCCARTDGREVEVLESLIANLPDDDF